VDLSTPRRSLLLLALATGLVALAFVAGPAAAPPLYDGVCVANPYQYLSPPPGAPTTPPTTGKHDLAVHSSVVTGSIVMTQEFPPQAQMSTDDGTLLPHAGTATIHLRITAVPPPAAPTDGVVDGNVYSITATDDAGAAVPLDAQKPATVTLRTTSASGQPEVVEHYDGHAWQRLATQPGTSCAFYFTATTAQLGDFVLVVPGSGATSTPACTTDCPTSSGSGALLAAVGGALLLVIATVIVSLVIVRRRREREAARQRRGKRRR
jgi:hypothetical protein